MSEGQLPAYVDTRRAFLQEAEVSGSVALERLPRFREMLAGDGAKIVATLRFTLSDEGQRQITGNISMHGEVPCQRCLEPVGVSLQDDISLILGDYEAAAATLKPDWDPWLFDDYKQQLADIVEEQLILSLPILNFHIDRQCIGNLGYQAPEIAGPEGADADEGRANPFSVLKALKEDKK